MQYTTVFWDFNGTIANDVLLGISSVNRMLKKRDLPTLDSVRAYHDVFCFPVKEYYRRLGFDFEKEPYEILAVEWVDNYVSEEHTLTLNPGFLDVSDALSRQGIQQIIISSSETAMLNRHLTILGIQDRFDRILGMDNIYAGGKIEMARRCVGNADHALFIGDTVHDADTAEAIGADCILYSGGHSSREQLSVRDVPVVDHLSEILAYMR